MTKFEQEKQRFVKLASLSLRAAIKHVFPDKDINVAGEFSSGNVDSIRMWVDGHCLFCEADTDIQHMAYSTVQWLDWKYNGK
jgi:hypothetical protein